MGVLLIHATVISSWYGRTVLLTYILILVNCISRFAVPIFVMLSGFYLSLNPRNEQAAPFYRRTLKYFLIPYVIYSVMYSMFEFRKSGNVIEIIRDLLTAKASPHLWFVLLILQLYLLHPVLSRWYRARRHSGIIVICAFIIQIAWNLLFSILFQESDLLRSGTPIVARYGAIFFVSNIGYFLGGYYLLEHTDEAVRLFNNRKSMGAGAFFWLLAATGLAAFWGIPKSLGPAISSTLRTYIAQGLLTPLLSIAALVTLYSFFQNHSIGKKKIFRLLNSLGLYSYGIYYIHSLVYWSMNWIFSHVFKLSGAMPVYYLLLFVSGTLFSLIAVKIISRFPFGRFVT